MRATRRLPSKSDDAAVAALLKRGKVGLNPNNIEQVSHQPRVYVYRGLLSSEECDHIIAIGAPTTSSMKSKKILPFSLGEQKLQRSMVVGAGGKSMVGTYFCILVRFHEITLRPADNARTSYGAFLTGGLTSDPVLVSLTERLEEWAQIPQTHGEEFYLLRYIKAQTPP